MMAGVPFVCSVTPFLATEECQMKQMMQRICPCTETEYDGQCLARWCVWHIETRLSDCLCVPPESVLKAPPRLRAYRPGICCRGVLQSRPSGSDRRCPAVRAGGAIAISCPCLSAWCYHFMHLILSAEALGLKSHAPMYCYCKVGHACELGCLGWCCLIICMRVQTGPHPRWQTQRRSSTKPSENLFRACTTMSFRSSWFSSTSCGTTGSTAMMRSAIPSFPVAS